MLIIHSDETQPDREDLPAGEWTIAESTRTVNKLITHVVEVHDPRGKWVGDISPDRAALLLNKFTVATRDPTLCGRLKPGTFQQESGLLLLRYQSGRKLSGNKRVRQQDEEPLDNPTTTHTGGVAKDLGHQTGTLRFTPEFQPCHP